MTHYSPWADLAARPGLTLEWADLHDRLGEYLHDLQLIRLRRGMLRRQARCVLAHELRHHDTGDVPTGSAILDARQERRADREAARLLIDLRDLGDALVLHDCHLGAVAVELHVSRAAVENRLRYLHPAERGYLTRRLQD